MLKWGILGAGRIAGVHAMAITTIPGSRIVTVSDITTEAASKLALAYGGQPRSTAAIHADPANTALLIATSTDIPADKIALYGPAPVSFRSGAHVMRPSFRKPRGISSRGLSVFGAGCKSR